MCLPTSPPNRDTPRRSCPRRSSAARTVHIPSPKHPNSGARPCLETWQGDEAHPKAPAPRLSPTFTSLLSPPSPGSSPWLLSWRHRAGRGGLLAPPTGVFYLIRRGLSGKTSRKGKTIARPQPRLARRRPARPRAPTAGILPAGTGMCPAPLPRL